MDINGNSPKEQSERQKERNRKTFKISLVANGFIVDDGFKKETFVACGIGIDLEKIHFPDGTVLQFLKEFILNSKEENEAGS
jgi:hypothetical protein